MFAVPLKALVPKSLKLCNNSLPCVDKAVVGEWTGNLLVSLQNKISKIGFQLHVLEYQKALNTQTYFKVFKNLQLF